MFMKNCLFLAFIGLFFSNVAYSKTLPESIENIQGGTVLLGFMVDGLGGELRKTIGRDWFSQPAGSGFLVSKDGYVITALHVIDYIGITLNTITAKKKNPYVNIPIPPMEDANHNMAWGNFISLDFDVVDRDEVHDIALLKLRTNPFTEEFIRGQKA